MKAKDIMCKNVIIGSVNNDIKEISKLMKDNNIGFMPISDETSIIGVITDRDIVINIIANNDIDSSLKAYLNTNIITCDEDDDIANVLDKMKTNKIKRILVKSDKKLVGIISLSDILNCDKCDNIIDTLKTIYKLDNNNCNNDTAIDEFYL